jgi:hypothetical protein
MGNLLIACTAIIIVVIGNSRCNAIELHSVIGEPYSFIELIQSRNCILVTPGHTTIVGNPPQNCAIFTNQCGVCATVGLQFSTCGRTLSGAHRINPGQSYTACDAWDPSCGNAVHSITGVGGVD